MLCVSFKNHVILKNVDVCDCETSFSAGSYCWATYSPNLVSTRLYLLKVTLFQNDDVVNVEQIINICDSSLWTTLTSNLVTTVYATMELHCSFTVMWSLMTILSIGYWMLDVDISLQSKYFIWATCCPNKAIAALHDKELKKYFSRHGLSWWRD